MDRSAVTWVGLAVAALVFLDLLFVELRRIASEAKRLVSRLRGYTELPVFSLLETARSDADRIGTASEEIPVLIERGRKALGVLRGYLPKGYAG